MPIDIKTIQSQIKEMGAKALAGEARLGQLIQKAMALLDANAGKQDFLNQLVSEASTTDRYLRCAIPGDESLNQAFPLPVVESPAVILAADGSQINPDRHDRVEFGLVNIGIIRSYPADDAGSQPFIESEHWSELLYRDPLQWASNNLTEQVVSLRRDLSERKILAEKSLAETLPVIALTDGPLELYREPVEKELLKKMFEEYMDALDNLADISGIAAGYVDKPRANLVTRLLELVLPYDRDDSGEIQHLHGVLDAMLFQDVLQPGERSAVFGLQSGWAKKFMEKKERLALHFFYLNAGFSGRPSLARIEIPAWVADSRELVDLLHFSLVSQCRKLGTRPYPYILHRAHEEAVVGMREKEQVAMMVATELRQRGLVVGEPSNKQVNKDISGSRTRYAR